MEVDNNDLTYLNIQNTVLSQDVDNHFFDGNPNLIDICVDQGELAFIEQRALDYGYVNADVRECILGTGDTLAETIQLYPNPVSEILNIEGNSLSEITILEIYNVQGQKINHLFEIKEKVDLSNLNSGVYFLKLITTNGTVTKKIIKI